MKRPAGISSITLSNEPYESTYPPLGFHEFSEHQLGNGDVFGLYWPVGYEDDEPLIAETWHDEWSIRPQFSSLERFLAAADSSLDAEDEEDGWLPAPDLETDPASPVAGMTKAREMLKLAQVDEAIALLEAITRRIPEYVEAQALLSAQLRRVKRSDDAVRAGLIAVRAPACFGTEAAQVLAWLARQSHAPEDCADDPLWLARGELKFKFGGTKENPDYGVLRRIIDSYLAASEWTKALMMIMSYGDYMRAETTAFQARHDFEMSTFLTWQREVALRVHPSGRTLPAVEPS